MIFADRIQDGIQTMVPREKMHLGARKLRDIYNRMPDAPLYHCEFGYYCLERWEEQGLPDDVNLNEFFHYDPPGRDEHWDLGVVYPPFDPPFEVKVLQDQGEYELVQDEVGQQVLYFKGRREGFMPQYVATPVKDMKTWEEKCKWRLDPTTPSRYAKFPELMKETKDKAAEGMMVTQHVIGGYMYLRALMGNESIMYKFHDDPKLIHDCMQMWFKLLDAVIARKQEYMTFDELWIAEDICYNHGPLISLDMMREFLFPYYRQLINNMKLRQIDKHRHLYIQVDTDGYVTPVIPLYIEIGMDVMSPFEVAAGCDVVALGRQFPELIMTGGIDKRILAKTKYAIDKEVERIIPVMRARGGYIPTCDHGVPEEVPLENYLHYRKRCVELGG